MPGDSPHWTTVGRGPFTDIVDAQICRVYTPYGLMPHVCCWLIFWKRSADTWDPFFHARHGEFKKTLRKPQELFSDNEWQAFGVCLSVMRERYSSFTTSVLDLLRGPFVFAQSTLWYSSNWCPCSEGVGVGGRFRIADVDRLMIEALLGADFWRTTWLATLQLVALPFPEEDAARCKDRCNDICKENEDVKLCKFSSEGRICVSKMQVQAL